MRLYPLSDRQSRKFVGPQLPEVQLLTKSTSINDINDRINALSSWYYVILHCSRATHSVLMRPWHACKTKSYSLRGRYSLIIIVGYALLAHNLFMDVFYDGKPEGTC